MQRLPKADPRFFREELYDEIAKIPLNDSVTLMMIDSKILYEDLKKIVKELKPFMEKDLLKGLDWIKMSRIFSPIHTTAYGWGFSDRTKALSDHRHNSALVAFGTIIHIIFEATQRLSKIYYSEDFKEVKEYFEEAVNLLKDVESAYEKFKTIDEKLSEAQIEQLKAVIAMGRHSDNMDWVNSKYHKKLQKTINSMIKRK